MMPGTSKGAHTAWETRWRAEAAWQRQQQQRVAAKAATGLTKPERVFLYQWAVGVALAAGELGTLRCELDRSKKHA
jgi:hypothetical protein